MSDGKYIFFLDIDGTLYTDGVICPENEEAIASARAAGHKVFLNTGRAPGIIPPVVKALPVDGWVAAIGSNIVIDGRYVYSNCIPAAELAEVYDYFDGSGRKVLFEGNDCVVINGGYDPCGYDAVRVFSSAEFLEKFGGRDIPKVFVPHVLPQEEADYFAEKFTFFQHPTYVELSPKGDTKSTGMKRVLDYYLPEKYRTVAMGDSLNDVEMLRAADVAVCMGDSHPALPEMCDVVTRRASLGGVAEAIRRLAGI